MPTRSPMPKSDADLIPRENLIVTTYKVQPHRPALRKRRASLPHHVYFITKCLLVPDMKALVIPACAEILINSIIWARDAGWWRILGFTVMPDHYHLIVGLGEIKSLSDAIAGVSKYTARNINQYIGRTGSLWEEGFYDHMLRGRGDFDNILEYTHRNPVKKGLIEMSVAKTSWSS